MGVIFLPDLRVAAGLPSVRWPLPGSPSAILHESARRHASGENAGALSIKCMFGGGAMYETAGRRVAVDDSCYLLLNHGQPYSIEIESDSPVESFCVFFQAGFVESVHRTLLSPESILLDEPMSTSNSVSVFDRRYPRDDGLMDHVIGLRAAIRRGEPAAAMEERMYGVAEALLQSQQNVFRESERLPAARAATREELYRRLHHARDMVASCWREPLTVAQLATVACLSPYHFLRQYRALFGVTPHQDILARRLDAAHRLLAATDVPVTQVASDCGFESASHFATAFRRHFGLSPLQCRRSHASRAI